jgi:hypothetical protein
LSGNLAARKGAPGSVTSTLPVHLLYAANRFLPIKMRAFMDLAAPRLKRVFAGLQPLAF